MMTQAADRDSVNDAGTEPDSMIRPAGDCRQGRGPGPVRAGGGAAALILPGGHGHRHGD